MPDPITTLPFPLPRPEPGNGGIVPPWLQNPPSGLLGARERFHQGATDRARYVVGGDVLSVVVRIKGLERWPAVGRAEGAVHGAAGGANLNKNSEV